MEDKIKRKDPAFLFYYEAFKSGVEFMSLEAIGAYIKILCYQADKWTIPKEHMLIICQRHERIMLEVSKKFVQDDNGEMYNERLRIELNKRKAYSESRAKNRTGKKKTTKSKGKTDILKTSSTYDNHMKDKDKDKNEDVNRDKDVKLKIKEEKLEIVLPFQTEKFTSEWDAWRSHLKSKNKLFKSMEAEQRALRRLQKLVENNESRALDAIDYSISQGYVGIFEEKNQKNGIKKQGITDAGDIETASNAWNES